MLFNFGDLVGTNAFDMTWSYLLIGTHVEVLLFGEYFWSPILWWYVWLIVCSPQIMLAHYWKANEVKQRRQKNIQNKAVQTKLSLYINKYMKKETLQIF